MINYKGYEIRQYETMGIGTGIKYEAWKDGKMWAFANTESSLKGIIEILIKDFS